MKDETPRRLPQIKSLLVAMLVLIGALPLLAFGLLQANRWREFTTGTDDSRMIAQLEILHEKLERLFQVRMTALELVAENLRPRPNLVGPRAFETLRYHVLKFGLLTAGIMDSDGTNLESFSVTPGLREKFAKMNMRYTGIWDVLDQARGPSVAPIRRGTVTQDVHIAVIAAPIWDLSRRSIRGAVGSSVPMSEIQKIADAVMSSTPHLSFVIADQNGTVAAASRPTAASGPLSRATSDFVRDAPSGRTVIREGRDENGAAARGAIRRLELYNADWSIGVTETLEYLRRQERAAWIQTLIGLGGILFLSLLLARMAAGLIARPILHIIDAMNLIGSGQYKLWRDTMKRPFGFRETTNAWNALSNMARTIADHRENLETLIAERTEELVRTYRELDEQRARSVESARLASLGEMAGGIAHEINTPLSSLTVLAADIEDMAETDSDPEATAAAAKQMKQITNRIARIVKGLRAVSRDSEHDPFVTATVQSIFDTTLDLCRERFANSGIDLFVAPIPTGLELECRPVQISQILLNLLNNAFDAVQGRAEKRVALEARDRIESIELRVSDSGPGVPAALTEKIFQPFYTTKDVGKGTGLGLSISSRIASGHHGRLFLDAGSRETTFVVALPKRQPSSEDGCAKEIRE